jgi:3,4-dihydroxy 2-butanone 4-phosphate synthase
MSTEIDTKPLESSVERAIAAFRTGNPVCIHDFDDREGETDLVYPAASIEHRDVATLRNDAGGLICVALGHHVATELDLPFLQDIIDHPVGAAHELSYDDRSSFSLTVNHRDTDTGVTDSDRALTISRLAAAAARPDRVDFATEFRAPGHVHLLKAAEGLLADRRGHTELGLALADAANSSMAVVVCEMLDDATGDSLSKTDAREYAARHGIPFVSGDQLLRAFR